MNARSVYLHHNSKYYQMKIDSSINIPEAVLVDVRESLELMFDRIEGAINIPLRNILGQKEKFAQMNKPIILFCRSGSRSQQAMLLLKASGINDVHNGGSIKDVKNALSIKN